jgi:hypothetical protein
MINLKKSSDATSFAESIKIARRDLAQRGAPLLESLQLLHADRIQLERGLEQSGVAIMWSTESV